MAGAMYREAGADYFNPDEAARRIRSVDPGISLTEANGEAWQQGRRLLERAIAERLDFAFETTLGANTIPGLLQRALGSNIEVRVWYVGLESPELHIARVRARVKQGGHDIPEAKIHERYDTSRQNLINLLPRLTELRLHDNSVDADPRSGKVPAPRLLLHWERGRLVSACELRNVPEWAKPILAAAIQLAVRSEPGSGGPKNLKRDER